MQRGLRENTLLNNFWILSGVPNAATEKCSKLIFPQTHVKPNKGKSCPSPLCRNKIVLQNPALRCWLAHPPIAWRFTSLHCQEPTLLPTNRIDPRRPAKSFLHKTRRRHWQKPPSERPYRLILPTSIAASAVIRSETCGAKPTSQVGNHPATEVRLREGGGGLSSPRDLIKNCKIASCLNYFSPSLPSEALGKRGVSRGWGGGENSCYCRAHFTYLQSLRVFL